MSNDDPATPASPPKRVKYVRSVGPRLRILLYVVLGLTALLGANSIYLVSITALEWLAKRFAWERQIFQDYFYQYMFLVHLVLGLLLVVPFVVFGLVHLWATRNRKNRRAVRIGYVLFLSSLAALVTGVLLMRIGGFDLKQPLVRAIVYWLHVVTPLACVWLYWLHRLAGPRIKWRIGLAYTGGRGCAGVADGGDARPGSAALVCSAFEGRREVLPALAGQDGHGRLHSAANADDGRLLPEVPRGRVRGLVPQRPSLQFVQQPGLSGQRARDAAGLAQTRRHGEGGAVVRRLP